MANEFLLIIDGSSLLSTQYYGNLPREILYAKTEEEKEILDTHTMDKIQMLLRDAGYLKASIAVEDMKNNFESVMKNKESEG